MKIAVLSDIHANYIALQAVYEHLQDWGPDRVIVAGDVVNRGPRPWECLQFVLEKQQTDGWVVLRGNHEDYVISQADPRAPTSGPAFEVHRPSYWTFARLGYDVTSLQAMPYQISLPGPDGREVRFVHASMRGNRDGVYPETPDRELQGKITPSAAETRDYQTVAGRCEPETFAQPVAFADPAVFAVGHTHRPLVRHLNGTLVVNAGSAGLPFDRDTRPSYAQLTWEDGRWEARIVRVEYDLRLAEEDFYRSGYVDEAGPLIQLVLIELRQARSQLFSWSALYQAQALAGQITMEESVRRFLNK